MREVLRSNDITKIAYAQALLRGEDIRVFELDVNASVLEGSLGILPRRLMVSDQDHWRAMHILSEHADLLL